MESFNSKQGSKALNETSQPLRLGLDVSAVPPNPAGAGRYVISLAEALQDRNDLSLHCFCGRQDTSRWETTAPSATVHACIPSHRLARLGYERTLFRRDIVRSGVQVLHSPHYTLAPKSGIPRVVTIHDLTFFTHPEYHQKAKVLFFREAIARAVKRADGLICVSQHTADQLRERFDVEIPIEVAEHGVDHERFVDTEQPDDAVTRKELGIDFPYVLFLGTLEPRKGVAELVSAFETLSTTRPELHLVLAGQKGWHFETISRALQASTCRDNIHLLGYVADASIPSLIRGARVVAYPSSAEGFGLPILESLACGAVVVTQGNTQHQSLFAGTTHEFSGGVEALAEAIDVAATNEELRSQLSTSGPNYAAQFSWSQCAQKHVDFYRRLLG